MNCTSWKILTMSFESHLESIQIFLNFFKKWILLSTFSKKVDPLAYLKIKDEWNICASWVFLPIQIKYFITCYWKTQLNNRKEKFRTKKVTNRKTLKTETKRGRSQNFHLVSKWRKFRKIIFKNSSKIAHFALLLLKM